MAFVHVTVKVEGAIMITGKSSLTKGAMCLTHVWHRFFNDSHQIKTFRRLEAEELVIKQF